MENVKDIDKFEWYFLSPPINLEACGLFCFFISANAVLDSQQFRSYPNYLAFSAARLAPSDWTDAVPYSFTLFF